MHYLLAALVVLVAGCSSAPRVAEAPPEPMAAPVGAVAPTPGPEPDAEPEAPAVLPPAVETEDVYQAISLALSLGDPEAAIAAYEQARASRADNAATQTLLANLYLAAGMVEEAATLLDQIISAAPGSAEPLYLRALLAGAMNDSRKQRELLQSVITYHPNHAAAHAALGELELQRRNFSAAERAFQSSLQHDPDNTVALIGMGNVRLRAADAVGAARLFTRVIEQSPDYAFAYADRSRAYVRQEEFGRAEADLNRAIELDRGYIWHVYDRGKVRLERRDYQGAVADLTTFLASEPTVFMAYVYRARAYDFLGERQAAYADYRRAHELQKSYTALLLPKAVLAFELNDYAAAHEAFAAAYRTVEPRDDAHALLAALALKFQDRQRDAARYLESVAARFTRPSLAHDMARYYISPSSDAHIFRQVTTAADPVERARMGFYLAAQYELLGRTAGARSLYQQLEDQRYRGLVESRLAAFRLLPPAAPGVAQPPGSR